MVSVEDQECCPLQAAICPLGFELPPNSAFGASGLVGQMDLMSSSAGAYKGERVKKQQASPSTVVVLLLYPQTSQEWFCTCDMARWRNHLA